jgi:hypothetical protein
MCEAITEPSRNTNFRVNLPTLIILFSNLILSTSAQAADPVGVLKFARGEINIVSVSGEARKAVKDDNLMQDERVITGAASIAVIRLNDDSRMTLRPFSEFRVNLLNTDDGSSQQSAVLNLLRGGLRLITGLIGKVNPAAYRLNTPVATIGIRGTEFNTRLCGSDCAAEEEQLAGSDAAEKITEGLYVNVTEGSVFLENDAAGEPLDINQGESGYVADLNSLPVKLSLVPTFQSLDKIPSPGQLDFDNIQIPDGALQALGSAANIAVIPAIPAIEEESAAEVAVVAAAPASKEETAGLDISGTYEIKVKYGKDLAHSDRKWFFGSKPDIEFTLTQKGDKIEGEFSGDRDGTIKGRIDDEEVTFELVLEARGGEYKDGDGTWIVQQDGSLKGDFNIRDQKRGVVRGTWVLTKID